MKKLSIFICFLLYLCHVNVTLLADDTFWYREGALETWATDALNYYVLYMTNDTIGGTITGTLICTEEKGYYALTNYHILKSTTDIVSAYLSSDNGQIEKHPCILIKGDPTVDLAIFSVSIREASENTRLGKYNKFISTDIFANGSDLTKGKQLMFLGFPLEKGIEFHKISQKITLQETGEIITRELSNPISKNAISRFGKISSRQSSSGVFLIDAMVSHGNSGSPVFIRFGYVDGSGTHSSYRFAGIVQGYVPDYIRYTSESGQQLLLNQNSGLGIVISIDAIRGFLKGK